MLTTTTQRPESLIATAIVVVALIVISVGLPFAILVGVPGLLFIGIRLLRSHADQHGRILGWVALGSGVLLTALVAIFALGLMAAGASQSLVESGPIQQLRR